MGMEDPRPTFRYLVECIRERYPDFAYIHVVDPRAEGNRDRIPGPSEVGASVAGTAILALLIMTIVERFLARSMAS